MRSEPIRDRLYVGSTGRYDVDFDGDADVEARLDSISGGLADVTFTILATEDDAPSTWVFGGIAAVVLIAGGLLFLVRRSRRATSNR